MYPFLRLATELYLNRRAPALGVFETHTSHHRCLPWDLDPWNELNNGRTLTLYDLGRIPAGRRLGLDRALAAQRWGMTVAGVSVRYRKRIQAFDRVEMHTRCLGWDGRFIYTEQSLWKGADCANQILLRSAVTSRDGIVAPARLMVSLTLDGTSPALPGWVQAWIAADAQRPWPPDRAGYGG